MLALPSSEFLLRSYFPILKKGSLTSVNLEVRTGTTVDEEPKKGFARVANMSGISLQAGVKLRCISRSCRVSRMNLLLLDLSKKVVYATCMTSN